MGENTRNRALDAIGGEHGRSGLKRREDRNFLRQRAGKLGRAAYQTGLGLERGFSGIGLATAVTAAVANRERRLRCVRADNERAEKRVKDDRIGCGDRNPRTTMLGFAEEVHPGRFRRRSWRRPIGSFTGASRLLQRNERKRHARSSRWTFSLRS
jgi:hypothetical protein